AKRGVKNVAKKAKQPARKAAKRAAQRPRAAAAGAPSKARQGVITHTELASENPAATRVWCESVLGWKFGDAVPTPTGPYHMWRFAGGTGGGIRMNNPPEAPGSVPYCEVTDIQPTYLKALKAGATGMVPPQQLPGGMGWIAMV